MNTPEKKAKYTKKPHCSGCKIRMNETLDSRIIRLQQVLAECMKRVAGGKRKILTDVDRAKLNFRIGQAEREILRINGGAAL